MEDKEQRRKEILKRLSHMEKLESGGEKRVKRPSEGKEEAAPGNVKYDAGSTPDKILKRLSRMEELERQGRRAQKDSTREKEVLKRLSHMEELESKGGGQGSKGKKSFLKKIADEVGKDET